jgi:hypothetical protein
MWRNIFCFCVGQYLFVPTIPVCYPYINSAVQFNYQLVNPCWCFSTKPPKVAPGPWELERGGAVVIKPTPLPPHLHYILLPQVQMAKPFLFAFLINSQHTKIGGGAISACIDIRSKVIDLHGNYFLCLYVFTSVHR